MRRHGDKKTGQTGAGILTYDDCARITASAINVVLEKLEIRQIVEGIAVLPAGEDVMFVDIVIRDLVEQTTWAKLITIPPTKEQADERD